MKIRWNYLLTIWGATLLPLLVAGIFLYRATEQRSEQEAGESLKLLAQLIGSDVDQYLGNLKSGLRGRSQFPDLAEALEAPLQPATAHRLDQALVTVHNIDPLNVSSIALFDRDGRKLADTDAGQRLVDEQGAPWIVKTRAEASDTVVTEALGPKPSIWIAVPARISTGEIGGLLRARLHLSALQQIVARATSILNTYAVVVDAQGTVLAHGRSANLIGTVMPVSFPGVGTDSASSRPGKAAILGKSTAARFAYATLESTGGTVAVFQDNDAFYGGTRQIGRIFVYLTLCALLLGGAAALIAAHFMAKPISDLANVAREIESGATTQRFSMHGPVEISELADAFNRMTARLQQSYKELERQIDETRRNEARLRDVINADPTALAVSDDTGYLVRLNPAFQTLLGYSLVEVPTVPDLWLKLFPEPDVLDQFRQDFSRHIDIETSAGAGPKAIEAEIPARDGTRKTVEIRARVFGPMMIITFHDLTARRRAELEVVRLNIDLEHRVAARTSELTQANAELESFSYAVSHDLRAPLRAIDGFSRALQEDYSPKLDRDALDYLSRIRAASQRMGLLIDDLLTLSKVSRAEVHRERFNLSQLAHSVWDSLQQGDSGRTVTFECAPLDDVEADLSLIRIVLENLLSNAWKYTRKRPDAHVSLSERVQDAPVGRVERVYVLQDNGAGFDMRYAGKLFGAFQRLHGQNEFEGTGIGLATVRRIINRHGGRIWAQAEVNQGATFFFTLSEARPAQPAKTSDSHSPFSLNPPRLWP